MNWNNLKESRCPECNHEITGDGRMTRCSSCTFKCRTYKIDELTKGKESKAYKAAVARNRALKKRDENNKTKLRESIAAQNKEKISNLRRMLNKGEVSLIEYESKMKSLS